MLWRMLLKTAIFYCESYKTIEKIVDKFNFNDVLSIRIAQEVMGERQVEANLPFIESNFLFLSSAFISLEENGKSLSNSVSIINAVIEI